jgi:hypothetical protein
MREEKGASGNQSQVVWLPSTLKVPNANQSSQGTPENARIRRSTTQNLRRPGAIHRCAKRISHTLLQGQHARTDSKALRAAPRAPRSRVRIYLGNEAFSHLEPDQARPD